MSDKSPAAKCTELKPCPFCGKAPTIKQAGKTNYWWVGCEICLGSVCQDCNGCGVSHSNYDKSTAIEVWNTRHFPLPPADKGLLIKEVAIAALKANWTETFLRSPSGTILVSKSVEFIAPLINSALNQAVAKVTKERDDAARRIPELLVEKAVLEVRCLDLLCDKEALYKVAKALIKVAHESIGTHGDKCESSLCPTIANANKALFDYNSLPESIRGKDKE